jgi:hypothetical protein
MAKVQLKGVALLLALGLATAWGMVVGGGLVYAWIHFVEQPERHSQARTVVLHDLPESGERRLEQPGAMVVKVVPDSPADRAGLQEGDWIVAVDGQRLGFDRELADLIFEYEPGDRVELVLYRAGNDSFRVQVRLGEHPERQGRAYLGVEYLPASSYQVPNMRIVPFESDEPFRFEAPLEDFEFDFDRLPGEFEFHVVPDWDDSF